jgi:cytochrome c oxidase cbb3-type subunit 3
MFAPLLGAALFGQAGPYERQRPTPQQAQQGARVYSQFCVNCHGALAKGSGDGPDLIRSVIVLRDREGSELGPALQRLPNHRRDLTGGQILDISNFLKDQIEKTASNRNPAQPPNVLTGDAGRGREYFNGAGRCHTCHSPTGDLAGVGRRYRDAVDLQQRFLFPRRSKPIRATVTPPNGTAITGDLIRIDDFTVALKTPSGEHRSWTRSANLHVELNDPLQAHIDMLDLYTDQDIHDVVRYLDSLK